MLSDGMVVLDSPLGVAGGTPNGRFAERGVTHTEHPKLGGQAIQVQANAVKVGIGGASRQRRSDCVLRSCVLRHGFLIWVQQNGVDAGQLSESSEER